MMVLEVIFEICLAKEKRGLALVQKMDRLLKSQTTGHGSLPSANHNM